MLVVFALAVGVLFACGVYLVLRGSLVSVAFGLGLLGTAINVAILVAARARHLAPPLIDDSGAAQEVGNPLPQAFVLTAIVIGFAVVTVLLALATRRDANAEPPAQ